MTLEIAIITALLIFLGASLALNVRHVRLLIMVRREIEAINAIVRGDPAPP